jgi:hypothetical protein
MGNPHQSLIITQQPGLSRERAILREVMTHAHIVQGYKKINLGIGALRLYQLSKLELCELKCTIDAPTLQPFDSHV